MANKPRSQYFPVPAHLSQTIKALAANPAARANARAASALLVPPEIPAANGPLPSPPALPDLEVWGINEGAAVTTHEQGLKVHIPPWFEMKIGDSVNLLLGTAVVATDTLKSAAQVGERLSMFIANERLTAGSHVIFYKITRFGQQPELSAETNIYVKLNPPGGADADGTDQGHSALILTLPTEIMQDGVDDVAAKAGVVVTIAAYPDMALLDHIKVSWGGKFVDHYVKEDEVGNPIEITVDEATILAAGDSGYDMLAVAFMVYDVVQNPSSDWSAEVRVLVDTGNARLDSPIVEQAVDSELDLEVLGNDDALVQVWVTRSAGFLLNDKILVKLVGTTTQGDELIWTADPITVTTLNHVYEALVPNDLVRKLAKTQAVFSYEVERTGISNLKSKGLFVNIIGEPVRLAAPIAVDQNEGALDPDLAATHVQVPWDDAFEYGTYVYLHWSGTYPDKRPYDPALDPHPVSRNDVAEKEPIVFTVEGKHLKEIEGGTLELFYVLSKDMGGVAVDRESAHTGILNVGEPRAELPAPVVTGVENGVLAPDHKDTQLRVLPYTGMKTDDEIFVEWTGSVSGDYTDSLPVTRYNLGKPVSFDIDDELVAGNEGGTVDASYWIERVDGTTSYSDTLHFAVGEPVTLDPPAISTIEDSKGNNIPAGGSTSETTVTLRGTAAADQTLQIFDGDSVVDDAVKVSDLSSWQTTLSDLAIAAHAIKAVGQYGSNPVSAVYDFTVTEISMLIPPQVPAVIDAKLSTADIPNGAMLVVPHWDGMVEGDQIDVTWRDDKGNTLSWPDDITRTEVGKDKVFTAALADVRKSLESNVRLTYEVTYFADGSTRKSEPLDFAVTGPAGPDLPAPVILEAEGSVLDPNNVLGGAEVKIGTDAQLKKDDWVLLKWVGQRGAGTAQIEKQVPADGELLIKVAYDTVKANDGHSVELSYIVTRASDGVDSPSPSATYQVKSGAGDGTLKVMGARFNRGSYRASATPRMISAFHTDTDAPVATQWRYEGETEWSTASSQWRDTRPELQLHARAAGNVVTLRHVNIVGSGADQVITGEAALAAQRDDGSVVAWGNAANGGESPALNVRDIVEMCANSAAYATFRPGDGSFQQLMLTWGDPDAGGAYWTWAWQVNPSTEVLSNLCSSSMAFAGISPHSHRVLAFGGGAAAVVSPQIAQRTDIGRIIGAGNAFAGITTGNKVMAWGDAAAGGLVPPTIAAYADVVDVIGNYYAFAALRSTGQVVAWGDERDGGMVPGSIAALINVATLGASTARCFSLITKEGSVKAWGDSTYGGDVPPEIASLTDIVEVTATWRAFAARRADGSVVAWGEAENGGSVPQPISELKDIVQVVGNAFAFAALRRTGEVVAWGNTTVGADLTSVATQLTDVRAIYANSQSFAALTADSRVVTWGQPLGGGDSSAVSGLLNGYVSYLVGPTTSTRTLKARPLDDQHKAAPLTTSSTPQPLGAWAAPLVSSAEEGLLEPGEDPARVIPINVPLGNLKWKDRVDLYIGDKLVDGIYVPSRPRPEGIGFEVSAGEFLTYLGATVAVYYCVTLADTQDPQPSDEVVLTISSGFKQDASIDLGALGYIIAETGLPSVLPESARMTREAHWGVAPYTYRSSNEASAIVDDHGTVTALRNGECSITSTDVSTQTQLYARSISGISVVHFLTGNVDWSGMGTVCAEAELTPITLKQFKALWQQYSDHQPVGTHLGWLDYPFWTSDPIGAGTYGTYDLSGADVEGNASSAEQSSRYQAVGVSSDAAQAARFAERASATK
jgi:hypothetical protein